MSDEETDEAKLELYNENLSPQQNRAVDLMIEGEKTNREIAKELEINEKTLWDWQNNNTEFIDELHLRKQQLFQEFYRKMNSMNMQATEIMDFAMDMAVENYRSEDTVDNCKKIFDMGKDLLKATGHHGDSLKELIEDMKEDEDKVELTNEEQAMLTELRTLEPDELEAIGNILSRYDADELKELGGLIESE